MALRRVLRDGERHWWPVERARARFEGALLIQQFGMELLGTEGPPDFRANGGNFAYGFADTEPAQAFVTEAEQRRIGQHAPDPDRRFHYRYLAVGLAERAADDLPRRSQAYAAVLCQAARWLLQTGEVEMAREVYRRYLREGAFVPWANRFGQVCPAPDFDAAGRFWLLRAEREAARWWRRLQVHAGWVAPLLVLGAGSILAVSVRLRRRPSAGSLP